MILRSCPLEGETGHEAAWRLLLEAYREATGEEALPRVAYGPRGKPFFPDSAWHFSLTHTRRHAFAALSDAPIGIDAEELDRPMPALLARRILSPMELEQYRVARDRDMALRTFWVLKEAQGKYTGVGLRLWPNDTAFSLDDPRVFRQDGCLVAVISGPAQGGSGKASGKFSG